MALSATLALSNALFSQKSTHHLLKDKKSIPSPSLTPDQVLRETMMQLQEKVDNVTRQLRSIEQSLQTGQPSVGHSMPVECERQNRKPFLLSECRMMQINILH